VLFCGIQFLFKWALPPITNYKLEIGFWEIWDLLYTYPHKIISERPTTKSCSHFNCQWHFTIQIRVMIDWQNFLQRKHTHTTPIIQHVCYSLAKLPMWKMVTNLSQITGGKKSPQVPTRIIWLQNLSLSLALVVLKSSDPCNYPVWKIQMHKKSNDLWAT
jgi:hypothetical protein